MRLGLILKSPHWIDSVKMKKNYKDLAFFDSERYDYIFSFVKLSIISY